MLKQLAIVLAASTLIACGEEAEVASETTTPAEVVATEAVVESAPAAVAVTEEVTTEVVADDAAATEAPAETAVTPVATEAVATGSVEG